MKHATSGQTDQLTRNVLKRLLHHAPTESMLWTLLEGNAIDKRISPIPQLETRGAKFEVLEIEPTPTLCVATAAHSAAVTTINVDDARPFVARDVLQVIRNGATARAEIVRVLTAGTTSFVVQARGMFGSTAAAIESGATLKKIGSALAEGFGATKGALHPTPTKHIGATQWHGEECAATSHRLAMEAFWGSEWPTWVGDMVNRLKKGVENSFFYNNLADYATTEHASLDATTPVIFTSDGINGRVTTNRFQFKGATYADVCDAFGVMRRNNIGANDMVWIGLCPQRSFTHISLWGADKLETRVTDDEFGFIAARLKIPGATNGILPLYCCPVLDEGIFENGLVILSVGATDNTPHIRLRYLQEGEPRNINWNIRAMDEGGKDITPIGYTGQILKRVECNVGLELNLQKRHAIFDEFASPMI